MPDNTDTSPTGDKLLRRPYRRVEDTSDDTLPQVAVKDKTKFSKAEVDQIATNAADKAQNEVLSAEDLVWKKRYSDLQSHRDKIVAENNKQIADLKAQLAAAKSTNKSEMPKTKEEVLAWATEYPDVYALLRTIIADESDAKFKAMEAKLASLEVRNELTEAEKARAILKQLHPDYETLAMSQDFHDWAKEQPAAFQHSLYEGNDPYAAGKVITLYKVEKGMQKEKTTSKKPEVEASRSVKKSGAANIDASGEGEMIKESYIKSLTPREFEKYEDLIDKAIAEGRVIYDLSASS